MASVLDIAGGWSFLNLFIACRWTPSAFRREIPSAKREAGPLNERQNKELHMILVEYQVEYQVTRIKWYI